MSDDKFLCAGTHSDLRVAYERVKDDLPRRFADTIIEAWWGDESDYDAATVTGRGLDALRLRIMVAIDEARRVGRGEQEFFAGRPAPADAVADATAAVVRAAEDYETADDRYGRDPGMRLAFEKAQDALVQKVRALRAARQEVGR